MLAPWAQYLVNHNLKVLVYLIALIIYPFSIVWYIVSITLPEIGTEIARDFNSLRAAKKEK